MKREPWMNPHDKLKCGRCGAPLTNAIAEACWYCLGPICADCWDRYGHCGHKRAAEMQEQINQLGGSDG